MWNSERVILDYVSVAWFRYLKIEERVAILYRDQTHCLPKWIRNLIFSFKNGGGGTNLSTINENYSHTVVDLKKYMQSKIRNENSMQYQNVNLTFTKKRFLKEFNEIL